MAGRDHRTIVNVENVTRHPNGVETFKRTYADGRTDWVYADHGAPSGLSEAYDHDPRRPMVWNEDKRRWDDVPTRGMVP